MTSMPQKAPDIDLPDPPGENPHYLRAVTELGEEQDVIVQNDIYATNGMKLLAKGAKINRQQFDHLVQHKLSVSLDLSLALERAVDAADLAQEAGRLIERDPLIARISNRSGDPMAIRHELACLSLPIPLPTRLTVMRAQRPNLFNHSLRTAMIAFALAQRLRLPSTELPSLLLAALCHDMGELHTDPELLMADHQITPEERRFIHVHPISAYLMLNEVKSIEPAVVQAVLQHHERMDGSGYPYGLKSGQISTLAKILAVADVAEAVIDKIEPRRLEMLLRVSQTRFDPEIVNVLRDLVRLKHNDVIDVPENLDTKQELEKFAGMLDSWFSLSRLLESQVPAGNSSAQHDSALDFLFDRMGGIRRLILQAGFDPGDVRAMAELAASDSTLHAELHDLLSEIDWLLRDLANEIDRRSPMVDPVSKVALDELVDHLRHV